MCGIAGIIGRVDEEQLRLMTQLQYHRGPDDGAIWIEEDGTAGLGHRRLSIIDLSPSCLQPMATADGRYILSYNGEVFNYIALREELQALGRAFRTKTDSEVLLHGFAQWGMNVVHRLIGQFAFAVWDRRERTLVLARDHLGVKPLYYALSNGCMYFASEAKSILAVVPESRSVNWKTLPQYLAFGWVPGNDTMFAGISKLPPGHYLEYSNRTYQIERYWNAVPDPQDDSVASLPEPVRVQRFKELFHDAVQSQLMSDVPLGLLLSGGIDSTAVLSSMTIPGGVPRAFTATYPQEARQRDVFQDDLPYAEIAARTYAADLLVESIETDIPASLSRAVWHLDEPLADPTIVTNLELTRAARQSLTVLLSGMGADEILAGYPRYPAVILGEKAQWIPRGMFPIISTLASGSVALGLLSREKGRRFLLLLDHVRKPFSDRFLGFASSLSPDGISALLTPEMLHRCEPANAFDFHESFLATVRAHTPLKRMLLADLGSYLPCLNLQNMDKTSMANSVEMRVPFLDHRLVEFCLRLPDEDLLSGMNRKVILRKAFAPEIPQEILSRSKTGYSPPVRSWVRHELREYIREMLCSQRCRERGIWRIRELDAMIEHNERGIRDQSMRLWTLLVLENWFRVFIDEPSHRPVVGTNLLTRRNFPLG